MLHGHKIFAWDLAFTSSAGTYAFDVQCEMLADIGYDGLTYAVWSGSRWETAKRLSTVKDRFGLEVFSVYVVIDLDQGPQHPINAGLLRMLEEMEGVKAVNLGIRTAGHGSNHRKAPDDKVLQDFLGRALEICARRGIDILLYFHLGFWMDHYSIAAQICSVVNHPNLGIVFPSYHWYGYETNAGSPTEGYQAVDPTPALMASTPFMRELTLSGATRSPHGWSRIATFEALDAGELDNFALLGLAKSFGYTGPVGYDGTLVGGNPYSTLKRSYDAMDEMLGLLTKHPGWAKRETHP